MDSPDGTGGFFITNQSEHEACEMRNPCLTKVMECQLNQRDWASLSGPHRSCSSPNLNSSRANHTHTDDLLIFQNEAVFGIADNSDLEPRPSEVENRGSSVIREGHSKARRPCTMALRDNPQCSMDSGGSSRLSNIARDDAGSVGADLTDDLPGTLQDSQPSNTTALTHNGSDHHSSGSRPDLLDIESRVSSHRRRQKQDDTKGSVYKQYDLDCKRTDFGDYYPDGGWGWVICAGASVVNLVLYGIHLSGGSWQMAMDKQFPEDNHYRVWLCSVSFGLCHLTSPLVVSACRRHSPRLLALAGSLLCGLACLFMSFSTEPHQVFISYSVVFAIASGITLQTSLVMVGRFFQCRRDCVEILCLSVAGVGLVAFTAFLQYINDDFVSWSRGTQLIGCLMLVVFAAVATYRSTALYHPRRRAIVHLKRSKKTQKQLRDFEDRPSYWDLSPLRMSSFRCLLLCAFLNGLGFYAPFLLLPMEFTADNFDVRSRLVVLSFLGFSFSLGVSSCGLLVLRSNQKCLVSKQYLCLTAGCMCGISTMLFAMAHGIKSYILFVVVFGISCGAFVYSLRLYVVELVTRRLSEVSLGYMHAVFGLGIILGTPAETFLASKVLYFRVGFIAAGLCMLLGSGLMFLGSITAKHPSNHQVIQAAYLRSNMAEEKLFEEMNISDSENSISSNNTHSHADSASGGSDDLIHRDKSPSFDWSHLASGTTTPASDKTKRSHHSDPDISRMDNHFHTRQNHNHNPSLGYGSSKAKSMECTVPPCYDASQDLIWMKRIQDPVNGASTSNGDSDVTAIHVSSHNSILSGQQMACVPAKTTYV